MKRSYLFLLSALLLTACADDSAYQDRISSLQAEIDYLQESNGDMLDKMSELSIINRDDAVSIRQSLEIMSGQQEHIEKLTERLHEKDSLNFVLVHNLKRSLIDVPDEAIDIEVKGNAVHVSISDDVLFDSASSRVDKSGRALLAPVATIINDHTDLEVTIVGHTDSIPIGNDNYTDNWDLSTSRALAVVRILQDNYHVDASRLTAAGRAEHWPIADNSDAYSRRKNRRIEVILKPDLGQFFELLTLDDYTST